MKGKRLLAMALLLLSLLLCACAEEKQEEEPTPKPRTVITIVAGTSNEDWLLPFAESFNAEQEAYEVKLLVEAWYHKHNDEPVEYKDVLYLLEDVVAADADAVCLAKAEYQFLPELKEDEDEQVDRYKDLFVLELDGRETGYEAEENVLLFVRDSKNIDGVCAFVEHLAKSAK